VEDSSVRRRNRSHETGRAGDFARFASLEPRCPRLVALRRALGAQLGLDRERPQAATESYVHRLTDADRARSLTPPGTRDGGFRTLYRFSNEALAEVRNATVHGFLATALVPCASGYVLYWAVYVKPVGAVTRVYMALIDPFRRLIVYPALLAQTQAA
jgi:uncharacterized protein DUF2867